MTIGTLNKPARDTKDWHTPLNENFGDIEYALNNHDRLGGPFFCHEQSTPDMSVRVDAGHIFEGGSLSEVGAQNTNTVSAPSSNDRIDRVVIDPGTGALSIETGSEASSPSPPSIPSGKMPLCQVYLTPSHSSIEDSDITDERVYTGLGSTMEDLRENLTVSAQWLNESWDTGDIKMSGVLATQSGWLLCNGQAVSRTTYSDLFNKIGTTFGNGDGSSTFNVPDFRDRSPVGDRAMNSSDAGRIDTYATTMGSTGGEDQHTLTVSEMPSHNHNGDVQLFEGSGTGSTTAVGTGSGFGNGTWTSARVRMVGSTGGDSAHNTVHPFIVVAFLIRT